jgi:hypothetical protein
MHLVEFLISEISSLEVKKVAGIIYFGVRSQIRGYLKFQIQTRIITSMD